MTEIANSRNVNLGWWELCELVMEDVTQERRCVCCDLHVVCWTSDRDQYQKRIYTLSDEQRPNLDTGIERLYQQDCS